MTDFALLVGVIVLAVGIAIYALRQYLHERMVIPGSQYAPDSRRRSSAAVTASVPSESATASAVSEPSPLARVSPPPVSSPARAAASPSPAIVGSEAPAVTQPPGERGVGHPLPVASSRGTAGPALLHRASGRRGSLLISPALPPEVERARLARELQQLAHRSRRQRWIVLTVGVILAGLIPLYLLVPAVHERLNPHVTSLRIRLGLQPPPPPAEPTLAPRDLEVSYSNELKETNGKIVLTGTVRNVSTQKTFANLFAELSLVRKESRLIETRVVGVKPATLAPGQEGRYELIVPASEFIGNRKVRIFADGVEIPYRYVLPEGIVEVQSSGSPASLPGSSARRTP